MTKIIEAQNITKVFGQGNNQTIALNNVSIEIEAKEFVSVMGPLGFRQIHAFVHVGWNGHDR